ncbi:hypothetical protein BDV37DRAFT_271077 [Aspergillus pseudonomiae]|uniref:Zn(2)-C6 fungal-type domain-containing protein n=1 Tax=Aspergillus pseudonomiae TaxID=1506151 RepID=A0A5N7DFQ1_9EURO|nr:uncharacterized protein BDV37DRAFT_271077 [Aspergillus pseudonomiae]KAE8404843.1 hypothetical protein BDV37DRAFT_271077 [Aspergillus pseudonomiae]
MESENTSDHTYGEPRVLRRYNVSRSCIRCHQRKVRCDKSHPCTTCARSNVTCRYPGSEKTKRRAPNRCRRFHSSGRSNWVLNGLTIYAAQSIGLHRDGSNFRLPILECELRRRLWWHIITADKRVAEDHGLVGGSETISNTKLPLNVDDSDLNPQMKTAPPPKETWTEMTMFLITAEASKVFARINRVSLQSQRGRDVHDESRKLVADLDARLSKTYLKYCDQNVPVQKATFLLGRLLLSKARAMVHIHSLNGLSAEQSAKHINEETLSYACEGLECGSEMLTDEVLKSYSWLSSTYTPYHLLTARCRLAGV